MCANQQKSRERNSPGGLRFVVHVVSTFFSVTVYAAVPCETSMEVKAYAALAPTYAGGCLNGFREYTVKRNMIYPQSNSVSCPAGQYYKNGSCVAYTAGDCKTGYVNETPAVTSGTFNATYAGRCLDGFSALSANYANMYLLPATNFRCGAGYYPTANGCVANPTTGCPTNYYAPLYNSTFTGYNSNGECDTDYSLYDSDMALCGLYVGNNSATVCTPLCESGYSHTHADTCARTCNVGITTLHTSNGLSWPLYQDKTVTPSINIRTESGDICYVNLLPGTASGTINVRDVSGNAYHAVE